MEPCSFGVSSGDCHKASYVRRTGLKRLTDFSEKERKVLLWRGGKMDSEQLRFAIITLRNWDQSLRKGLLNAAICFIFISDK